MLRPPPSLTKWPSWTAFRQLEYTKFGALKPIHSRNMTTQPRPSASLVIVNSRNEVLLVHRHPESRSFAGAHVFPGGNFDKKQDSSLAMTAVRETFEESGLLIASSNDSSRLENSVLDEARKSIHAQQTNFSSFLDENHLKADIDSLLPFTTWVTPVTAPRRFRTEFFLLFLPSSTSTGFSSGDKSERVPTHDGGREVIETRFLHPEAALQEFNDEKIALMPPQFYILTTLRDILQGQDNTLSQRETVRSLSRGAFGHMEIHPQVLPERDAEGRIILAYQGDEVYGGKQGRLHRALLTTGKGGVPKRLALQRNFDVFSEIETHLFNKDAKL